MKLLKKNIAVLIVIAGVFLPAGTTGCKSGESSVSISVGLSGCNAPARTIPPQTSIEALFNTYFTFAANDDFEGMYLLMSPEFRNKNEFAKFEKVMRDDLKISGGLKGGSKPEEVRNNGRYFSYRIALEYNNQRMTPRTVVVDIVMIDGAYYFNNGMLMPLAAFGKF